MDTDHNLAAAFVNASDAVYWCEGAALRLEQQASVTTKDEAAAVVAAASDQLQSAESSLCEADDAFEQFAEYAVERLQGVCTQFGLNYDALRKAGEAGVGGADRKETDGGATATEKPTAPQSENPATTK